MALLREEHSADQEKEKQLEHLDHMEKICQTIITECNADDAADFRPRKYAKLARRTSSETDEEEESGSTVIASTVEIDDRTKRQPQLEGFVRRSYIFQKRD